MKPERTIENMTIRDAWRCFRILTRLNYESGVPVELWQWQELAECLGLKTALTPAYLKEAGELVRTEGRRRKLRLLVA
jgi:hypothetical protein